MAFLINSYNAFTVKLVIDHYPVASIKKIGGMFTNPWGIEFFSLLEGRIKALDPIEHGNLRPKFKDYRIHAAVNCASVSCPPLRHEAYVGDRLDGQLEEQMRVWLADNTRNDFDGVNVTVKISKIFEWYKEDFDNWSEGVTSVLAKYAPTAAKAVLSKKPVIEYLDYDWALSDSK